MMSSYLTKKIMNVAMTACTPPRTSIEMFTVSADCTTCVSAEIRLINSPVRLVSKKPVSCDVALDIKFILTPPSV
jgi:hypothetical protein